MSKIGKVPVSVPKDVKVALSGSTVTLEGKKGSLSLNIPLGIKVEHKEGALLVTRLSDTKQNRAHHGTTRSHLKNMIVGITEGHKRELEIQGVGLRAQLQGKKVIFSLGFSHPVEFDVPKGVAIAVPTQTSLVIEGIDKAAVGLTASQIRKIKPPEPYKGKGIRFLGEKVRKKQGKSVTK